MARILIIVIITFIGWCFPDIALSNGLPHIAIQKNPNGTIVPLKKIPVAVDKEVLTIKLFKRQPAQITANYKLRNLSNKVINTSIIFPVSVDEKHSVIFNGKYLQISKTKFPESYAEDLEVLKNWIDPNNGRRYSSLKDSFQPDLEFILFEVMLKPNEVGNLIVSYEQPPEYDPNQLSLDTNFRVDYLLQPAKHWASFKDLEINVITEDDVTVDSSIKLQPLESEHLQAKFEKLPEENLSLLVKIKSESLIDNVLSLKFLTFGLIIIILIVWMRKVKTN